MAKGTMVTVRSITNPKVYGKYQLPGTIWECEKTIANELAEIGAIEIMPKGKAVDEAKLDKVE